MSFYIANAQIIKVKQELQNDIFCLFNENYEQIKNPVLKSFADEYFINAEANGCHSIELKYWSHHDFIDAWKGKYQTKYENGIFSFSYYYNDNGFLHDFYHDFEDIILPLITEEIIEQDGWCEPLD